MLRPGSHSHALCEERALLQASGVLGEHIRGLWKAQLSAGLWLATRVYSAKTPPGWKNMISERNASSQNECL